MLGLIVVLLLAKKYFFFQELLAVVMEIMDYLTVSLIFWTSLQVLYV